MLYETPLVRGILKRRYQRFLADVELVGGGSVIAHVPNSGAMRGCSTPGSPCLISKAVNPNRKLGWTLEQVIEGGIAVGINTARTNGLAEEALIAGLITPFGRPTGWTLQREVRLGQHSRIDFLLTCGCKRLWLEVKNVSWTKDSVALFPDAVTTRGTKHLNELMDLVRAGEQAGVLFVVGRGDAHSVRPADEIDPDFATALRQAHSAGVKTWGVRVAVSPERLVPEQQIPVLIAN